MGVDEEESDEDGVGGWVERAAGEGGEGEGDETDGDETFGYPVVGSVTLFHC